MPKKKTGKHLQFYIDCIENDCYMPAFGLCTCSDLGYLDEQLFKNIMAPSVKETHKIYKEGKNHLYWASDSISMQLGVFTPLRQTIVLFMAAIAGEL